MLVGEFKKAIQEVGGEGDDGVWVDQEDFAVHQSKMIQEEKHVYASEIGCARWARNGIAAITTISQTTGSGHTRHQNAKSSHAHVGKRTRMRSISNRSNTKTMM